MSCKAGKYRYRRGAAQNRYLQRFPHLGSITSYETRKYHQL